MNFSNAKSVSEYFGRTIKEAPGPDEIEAAISHIESFIDFAKEEAGPEWSEFDTEPYQIAIDAMQRLIPQDVAVERETVRVRDKQYSYLRRSCPACGQSLTGYSENGHGFCPKCGQAYKTSEVK